MQACASLVCSKLESKQFSDHGEKLYFWKADANKYELKLNNLFDKNMWILEMITSTIIPLILTFELLGISSASRVIGNVWITQKCFSLIATRHESL